MEHCKSVSVDFLNHLYCIMNRVQDLTLVALYMLLLSILTRLPSHVFHHYTLCRLLAEYSLYYWTIFPLCEGL